MRYSEKMKWAWTIADKWNTLCAPESEVILETLQEDGTVEAKTRTTCSEAYALPSGDVFVNIKLAGMVVGVNVLKCKILEPNDFEKYVEGVETISNLDLAT